MRKPNVMLVFTPNILGYYFMTSYWTCSMSILPVMDKARHLKFAVYVRYGKY